MPTILPGTIDKGLDLDVTSALESASTLDEKMIIIETRSEPIRARMASAFSELRQLDLEGGREMIEQRLSSRGRGSALLKSAAREAVDVLEAAHSQAADLLETADREAAELRDEAQRDADELIDDAIREATEVLEDADDEAGDPNR